jgi:hypothetical protein
VHHRHLWIWPQPAGLQFIACLPIDMHAHLQKEKARRMDGWRWMKKGWRMANMASSTPLLSPAVIYLSICACASNSIQSEKNRMHYRKKAPESIGDFSCRLFQSRHWHGSDQGSNCTVTVRDEMGRLPTTGGSYIALI